MYVHTVTPLTPEPTPRYHTTGTAVHGALRIYLATGSLSVNGDAVTLMGSSFWANAGADVDVTITGLAFVVGAQFALDARHPATHFSTSYRAPVVRKYDTQDAVGNTNNASNVHDIHINNGTGAVARDMLWPSTASHVDPPSIVVLNCAPTDSFVWSHSHPQVSSEGGRGGFEERGAANTAVHPV